MTPMGIAVEVPGLDTVIPELREGSMVVAEGGADLAKNFFVRRLTLTALRSRWPVTFVTSRDRAETLQMLSTEAGFDPWFEEQLQVVEKDSLGSLAELGRGGGLLVADSFSFLTIELTPPELSGLMRELRALCRERKTTIVLATDRGMFDPRAEAVTVHLSDGFIEFHSKEGPEGLVRFLRVPKWLDGKFVDRNVYYEFDGKRLAVDLRRRVL